MPPEVLNIIVCAIVFIVAPIYVFFNLFRGGWLIRDALDRESYTQPNKGGESERKFESANDKAGEIK